MASRCAMHKCEGSPEGFPSEFVASVYAENGSEANAGQTERVWNDLSETSDET